MAQIEQSDGGKKKKGAQKKMHIHVDFTPMVDMNMLLITFFMLCTTMIKSQTLNIALPAPPQENQTKENSEVVGESTALTLIVDTVDGAEGRENIVYWYGGFEPVVAPDGSFVNADGEAIENPIRAEHFLGNAEGTQRGIRAILHERNKDVLDEIEKQKNRWRAGEITAEAFDSIARVTRNDTNYTSRPQVTIKPADDASWAAVIAALDEMQINQITQYRIGTFNSVDSTMIAKFNAAH